MRESPHIINCFYSNQSFRSSFYQVSHRIVFVVVERDSHDQHKHEKFDSPPQKVMGFFSLVNCHFIAQTLSRKRNSSSVHQKSIRFRDLQSKCEKISIQIQPKLLSMIHSIVNNDKWRLFYKKMKNIPQRKGTKRSSKNARKSQFFSSSSRHFSFSFCAENSSFCCACTRNAKKCINLCIDFNFIYLPPFRPPCALRSKMKFKL